MSENTINDPDPLELLRAYAQSTQEGLEAFCLGWEKDPMNTPDATPARFRERYLQFSSAIKEAWISVYSVGRNKVSFWKEYQSSVPFESVGKLHETSKLVAAHYTGQMGVSYEEMISGLVRSYPLAASRVYLPLYARERLGWIRDIITVDSLGLLGREPEGEWTVMEDNDRRIRIQRMRDYDWEDPGLSPTDPEGGGDT